MDHKDFPGLKGIQLVAALRKTLGVKKGKLADLIREYNRRTIRLNPDVVFHNMHENSRIHAELNPAKPPFFLSIRDRAAVVLESETYSEQPDRYAYATASVSAGYAAFRQALRKGTARLLALLPDRKIVLAS